MPLPTKTVEPDTTLLPTASPSITTTSIPTITTLPTSKTDKVTTTEATTSTQAKSSGGSTVRMLTSNQYQTTDKPVAASPPPLLQPFQAYSSNIPLLSSTTVAWPQVTPAPCPPSFPWAPVTPPPLQNNYQPQIPGQQSTSNFQQNGIWPSPPQQSFFPFQSGLFPQYPSQLARYPIMVPQVNNDPQFQQPKIPQQAAQAPQPSPATVASSR